MAQTLSGQLTALLGNIRRGGFNMYQAFSTLSTILTQMNTNQRSMITQQFWLAPDAAAADNAATQNDLESDEQSDCPLAVASEVAPDYPRNIYVTGTQLTGATSVSGTITGLDQFGVEQVETFTCTTAAKVWTGSVAWSGVPVIAITTIVGDGAAGDLLDFGYGVKMGLNANVLSEADAIIKVNLDEADAGYLDGSVDGTNNTITFETAPNAARDFIVWYKSGITTNTFDV